MGLLNLLKEMALQHAVNNMSDEAITDLIVSYQKKEFGEQANKAIDITADKLIRIGLSLHGRVK